MTWVMPADVRQRELGRILVEHLDDASNLGIRDAGRAEGPIDGRQIVVRHRQMLLRAARAAPLVAKLIERQKRLPFIDQIEIDVKQILSLRRYHDHVLGPDFFEQSPIHLAISAPPALRLPGDREHMASASADRRLGAGHRAAYWASPISLRISLFSS